MDTVSRTKRNYATIKARNVAGIPDALKDLGADPDAVLRAAGVEPDVFSNPDNELPYAAVGRLVSECVRATGCEAFGLRVGARSGATAMGLTGLVSMHASTVGEALNVIVASLKTSDNGGAVVLDRTGDLASFGYVVTAPDVDGADQIVDGAMAIAFNTMRSLCGPAWRPIRVRLTRDPPRDKAAYAKFFEAPVEYAAPAASMIFDAATLDAAVRDRNPEFAAILAPLLEQATANAPGDFVTAVKSIMRGRIGAGPLTRDSVARALRLNPRSLARRLEAFGVTYSGLAEEIRYEAAQSLLAKETPIAQIVSTLGFAEPSAFTRAFKTWSGTTPARWRARRQGAQG